MAKCEFCDKDIKFGTFSGVPLSSPLQSRSWKPNVKRVKAIVNGISHSCLCLHKMPPFR